SINITSAGRDAAPVAPTSPCVIECLVARFSGFSTVRSIRLRCVMSSSPSQPGLSLPILGQLAPTAPLEPGPARRPKPTPPLPMSRAEMAERGWDEVDVVFVTGDAYVDHPSFAMALLGRLLESEGFRVGILSQPDWHNCHAWRTFGRPRLFF